MLHGRKSISPHLKKKKMEKRFNSYQYDKSVLIINQLKYFGFVRKTIRANVFKRTG